MTKVKICGIKNLNDAIFAVDYGADALGFVFAKSIRKVSKEKARAIVRKLPPFVTTVGLFVNETAENIETACRFCGLDAIQLHGNEPPGIINKLKDIKTIKAFRIQNEKDISPIKKYKPNAILLDGYSENQMGGTGTSFDWKIVKKIKDFHSHNSSRRINTFERITGYKNRKALRSRCFLRCGNKTRPKR